MTSVLLYQNTTPTVDLIINELSQHEQQNNLKQKFFQLWLKHWM
jgi:hypothetical protein